MTKRMLIDGAHPEESRVVIASTSRLEEYDVETSTKKQLKGNIYLAKVTRVEPSLQAAFVEFGGDRHGFLAFNDIHPDYFQIPVEDREALIAEESAQPEDEDAAQALVDDFDGAIDDHDDHDEEDEVEDPGPPGGNDPGDAESREPEPGEVDVAEQPEEDDAHAAPADEAAQSATNRPRSPNGRAAMPSPRNRWVRRGPRSSRRSRSRLIRTAPTPPKKLPAAKPRARTPVRIPARIPARTGASARAGAAAARRGSAAAAAGTARRPARTRPNFGPNGVGRDATRSRR